MYSGNSVSYLSRNEHTKWNAILIYKSTQMHLHSQLAKKVKKKSSFLQQRNQQKILTFPQTHFVLPIILNKFSAK